MFSFSHVVRRAFSNKCIWNTEVYKLRRHIPDCDAEIFENNIRDVFKQHNVHPSYKPGTDVVSKFLDKVCDSNVSEETRRNLRQDILAEIMKHEKM